MIRRVAPIQTALRHTGATLVAAGTAAAVALVAVPAGAAAQPAAAAGTDRGLYGSQDPTYDGVYRQGLAITGLVSVRRTPPQRAVKWLVRQQCGNGSFVAYRTNPRARCPKPDPATFSGPDSNSTALGAMALRAAGKSRQARKATGYLRTMQNRDGGFAFYRGGASDVNSTGLVLAALAPLRRTSSLGRDLRAAKGYLRRAQLRCQAPVGQRGLLAYQLSPKVANPLASAQAALGLVTTLPVPRNPVAAARRTPPLRCSAGKALAAVDVRDTLLDALTASLRRGHGVLPSAFGGPDYGATAQAATALAAAGRSRPQVRAAVRALRSAAPDYTGGRAAPDAGAIGTLLLFAGATGADERHFGGVDLVKRLRGSLR